MIIYTISWKERIQQWPIYLGIQRERRQQVCLCKIEADCLYTSLKNRGLYPSITWRKE